MTEREWLECRDVRKMLSSLHEGLPTTSGYDLGHGLGGPKISQRKLRLFACALCRQVWHLLTHEDSMTAVETAEMFADGRCTLKELRLAQDDSIDASSSVGSRTANIYEGRGALEYQAANMAVWVCDDDESDYALDRNQPWIVCMIDHLDSVGIKQETACDLLREIVGNPFRSTTLTRTVKCDRCNGKGQRTLGRSCGTCSGTGKIKGSADWLTQQVLSIAQSIYDHRTFAELPVLADCLSDNGCDDEELLNHFRSDVNHVRGCHALDTVLGLS